MSDTPRGGVWPLAIMALIVGLLATFVVIRFTRPSSDATANPPPKPNVVSTDKGPDTAPKTSTEPPKSAVKPPDPTAEQEAKKKAEEAASRLADARKAWDAGKLDDALAATRASRRLKETAEAAALEKQILEVQEVQAKERRDKQDAAMKELRDRVEKLKDENRWDGALAAVDAATDLRDHPDFARLRRTIAEFRAEAERSFTDSMAAAKKLQAEGRLTQARAKVVQAVRIYPERKEAQETLVELDKALTTTNMVRIPGPPRGVAVQLGDPKKSDEPSRAYGGGAFFIDKYEVTNEEYQLFVEATGHRPPASKLWNRDAKRVLVGAERYPVSGVTADDAEKYAAWAGKRLPTEDEWEYAARYVDGRAFPWGEAFQPSENVYLCNSLEYGKPLLRFEPTPVGAFPNGRSALDVMDMAGNVWEWTVTKSPAKEGRELRILKGGSFMTRADACRAANRLADDPEVAHHDVGFRCVRDR